MRGQLVALGYALMAGMAAACGLPDTPPDTPPIQIAPTVPTATKTVTTAVAAPDGWANQPPTPDQLEAMKAWSDGPGAAARATMTTAGDSMEALDAAIDEQNLAAVKTGCGTLTEPLTAQLPTGLPAPDADLTNAFQAVITNAEATNQDCAALGDPPNPVQIDTFKKSLAALHASMQTAESIVSRDDGIVAR